MKEYDRKINLTEQEWQDSVMAAISSPTLTNIKNKLIDLFMPEEEVSDVKWRQLPDGTYNIKFYES